MKILVQFPVRTRVEKFFKTLTLYYSFAEDLKNIFFNIICDEDDIAFQQKEVYFKFFRYSNLKFTFYPNKTKVEAINAGIPVNDWDILVLASDDMIPQVYSWDKIIIDEMSRNFPDTDGVLWFFDGFVTDLNTLCILGKKYYDRFGYIYNPEYKSLWCDNEFTDVANILKKQKRFNSCIIRHEHPINMKQSYDNLLVINERYYSYDKEIYLKRKKDNFYL
jgi:hypothetical protein